MEHNLIIYRIPTNSISKQKLIQRILDHYRQLTRATDLKQKIGEKTSHSYWSWTHGPRGTTHDTSGKNPWWWRSSRRTILPSTGCREEVFWCSRSWKRGGGGTEGKIAMRGSLHGLPGQGVKMGRGGARGGGPASQAPWWRGREGGCVRWRAGWGLVPLRRSFSDLEVSVLLIFYLIFVEYL